MSEPVELNQSIDEQTRQAYLSALQVEQWMPLSDLANIESQSVASTTSAENIENDDVESKSLGTQEEALKQSDQSSVGEILKSGRLTDTKASHFDSSGSAANSSEENSSEENSSRVLNSKDSLEVKAQVETEVKGKVKDSLPEEKVSTQQSAKPAIPNINDDNQSSHFLKQVNWSNRVLSEESAKSLMIVCRHQVDQPANSFARSSSPSQFMMDYINALNHFCANDNFELKIQLAHLSAAGLSKECVPLEKAIKNNNPKAMLLLGDETVSHILGESMEVASCRGQMHKLADGTKVLVSYHPFSLIQNPSLKRLAFEDLALASEFLASND